MSPVEKTFEGTRLLSVPVLSVKVRRGKVVKSLQKTRSAFKIGRGEECDIQFAEGVVSRQHAAILPIGDSWYLKDLGSRNGTYVDGQRVTEIPLPLHNEVVFAKEGPAVVFSLDEPAPVKPEAGRREKNQVSRIFSDVVAGKTDADERVRRFLEEERRRRQRHRLTIGVLGLLVVVMGIVLIRQLYRQPNLEELRGAAEEIFYEAKELEIKLATLENMFPPGSSAQARRTIREAREARSGFQDKYAGMMEAMGVSRSAMTTEEWLIHKVARDFGECDAAMPAGFVDTVRQYVRYWQSTPRYREGIDVARNNGYTRYIKLALGTQRLPEGFFYLALQESKFDTAACGPETNAGIAKGMWQFIPSTAKAYGIEPGPFANERRYDRYDARHSFERSTEAAARYLRDLYQSDAQASGLLVMACYNWREERVLGMLRQMPGNPRDRNFWKLIQNHRIPRETYDYVFYIFAAAVIGEDPRAFGFTFDNPLK